MLAEGCLEKYAKKLFGKTEMEDALKRLDRLTQEEARMAAAENLRLTHAVDKKVEGVADTVIAIDNRVTGVDERVAGVDDRVAGVDEHVADVIDQVADVIDQVADVIDQVAGVDERVAGVDDRVAGIDEHVAGVHERVAGVVNQVAVVNDRVQQTANDVDEIKRLSSLNFNQCRLPSLTYLFRESMPGEHSQMALPTGPLDEPQHRMWYSSQETRKLVL